MSVKATDNVLSDISEEDAKYFHELFTKLDVDKDGKIDINDLTRAMECMQVPHGSGHAEVSFDCSQAFRFKLLYPRYLDVCHK